MDVKMAAFFFAKGVMRRSSFLGNSNPQTRNLASKELLPMTNLKKKHTHLFIEMSSCPAYQLRSASNSLVVSG